MSKVVVIAGMHRSGTSMIARLLNLCGVYLGPESDLWPPGPDNLEGYWENVRFTQLNDKLLSELNGGWDCPPRIDSDWQKLSNSRFQSEASKIIQQFSSYNLWGWKDPRNSLTFPFWNELIPSMKVVVCVRNPLEVANSLSKRNYFSPALAFHLWFEYNKRVLLATDPKNRIITHYNTFFHDPLSELLRILTFLEVDIPEDHIKPSIATVNIHLRHNQSTSSELIIVAPSKVIDLYQKMCDQNGEDLQYSSDIRSELETSFDEDVPSKENAERKISQLSVKLNSAKNVIAEKEKNLQMLRAQLDAREKELSDIYQSKAWHFIQFIRRTRQKILG